MYETPALNAVGSFRVNLALFQMWPNAETDDTVYEPEPLEKLYILHNRDLWECVSQV